MCGGPDVLQGVGYALDEIFLLDDGHFTLCGGRPLAAFGTMAGEGQPQIQVQVAINLFDRGLEPAEAVADPRVRVSPGGEVLWVEADYAGAAELNRSRELPKVELVPPRDQRMGHAQALLVDAPAGWRAGADPRADGSVELSDR